MKDNNNNTTNTTIFAKNYSSSLMFVSAIALLVFVTSFSAIIPGILQTAAAVALPTGEWEIHSGGYIGTLRITNIDPRGIVTGTLELPPYPLHNITGLYNERAGTLRFDRIILNQQDALPSLSQAYYGYDSGMEDQLVV